jgi:hypothetical protein
MHFFFGAKTTQDADLFCFGAKKMWNYLFTFGALYFYAGK